MIKSNSTHTIIKDIIPLEYGHDCLSDNIIRKLNLVNHSDHILLKVIPPNIYLTFEQENAIVSAVEEINYARKCKNVYEYLIKDEKINGYRVSMFEIPESEKQLLVREYEKMPFNRTEINYITKQWNNRKNSIVRIENQAIVSALEKLNLISIIKDITYDIYKPPVSPENYIFLVKLLVF